MAFEQLLWSLPFAALYAETHFRFFPLQPSLLYSRTPEVIFDMPRRLAPGHDLPLILIVNDIHRFPRAAERLAITVTQAPYPPRLIEFPDLGRYAVKHPFQHQQAAFVIPIPRRELPEGEVLINARVTVAGHGRSDIVVNDNLVTSSKEPLRCLVSASDYPGSQWCAFGDLHLHSQYSQSHVEFGPPLTVIDQVAASMGLDFVAITDHSYDLACRPDNYLSQDPALQRWRMLSEEFRNDTFRTTMLQGEEVSCLNRRGEVVHLGALGIDQYIPGSLDGARRSTVHKRQLSIPDAVAEIHCQGGLAFAAHPGADAGLLQRLLLRRGVWDSTDVDSGLDGFQALNSSFTRSWDRAISLWINALQRGLTMPLLAGNDAHGDFNRYRAIGRPFLNITESFDRHMGHNRTGVYGRPGSAAELLGLLRRGSTFVTDGPFLSIAAPDTPERSLIGLRVRPGSTRIRLVARSAPEFGALDRIRLIAGKAGSPHEEPLFSKRCGPAETDIDEDVNVQLDDMAYLRAEATCHPSGGSQRKAFTSALFIRG